MGFIYLFLCSRQSRSPVSPAWVQALEQLGGCGSPQRAGGVARGRGLTAGRGLPGERDWRAHPRLAASSRAGGDCSGGQNQMLAGSLRLLPYLSPVQLQLAPAGEGDPVALCPRTLVFQPPAPPENLSARRCSQYLRAVPKRPPPDRISRGPRPPSLFLSLQRRERGESGIYGGERGDRDTDDG